MELKAYEAKCPKCGCLDVDISFSDNPIQDGVKCWDCGHVYPLTRENAERRPELDLRKEEL